jgi:hypothetical protein
MVAQSILQCPGTVESRTGLFLIERDWGGRRGLNPRHSVPQTDALPAELLPPTFDLPSLRYFLVMEKRLRKAPAERSFPVNLQSIWPILSPPLSLNLSTRPGHPIFIAGIARSRPKRLQYAKQNLAQA